MTSRVQIKDGSGWMSGLRRRAAQTRLPLSAVLELTERCNLRCQHCYIGPQEDVQAQRGSERGTEAVMKSLDEWAEAGCLNLLITGGDPMVRADFSEIYRHACELGMVVTVFSNGTLVTDRMVELFRERPPRRVEITVYGATAETYEQITRVPGSHRLAWEGIHRLHTGGIRLVLKTMLMTLNQHELEAMAEQAQELGCRFRFDAAVFPCLMEGSKTPLDLRVSPEEAVRLDMALPEQRERWIRSVMGKRGEIDSDRLYPCGAGATSFYADPYGYFSPCLMTKHFRYAGQGRAFRSVWSEDLSEIRSLKRTPKASSFSGRLRGACSHCPALNKLETGDEEIDSDYMRTTTRLRYEAVMETQKRVHV